MTTVTVLRGSMFLVSDVAGDAVPAPGSRVGLFYRDTRHLSRWELELDGRRLEPLADAPPGGTGSEALFVLAEPTLGAGHDPHRQVVRRRRIGRDVEEEVEVTNFGPRTERITLTVRFDADFADLFDVKARSAPARQRTARRRRDAVELTHRREGFRRTTRVVAAGAELTDGSAQFALTLRPGEHGTVSLRVCCSADDEPDDATPHPQDDADWLRQAPELDTDWEVLRETYRRSLADLALLRFYPDVHPQDAVPAAGAPWFMALFGRDALLTSYSALPYLPSLARSTLLTLADHQATTADDFRDAQPGKILHELRHGERARSGEAPQSPYYGSADSTTLFLILLEEYLRWTGDADLVRHLEGPARAALDWLERYADDNGDGYVDYRTRNPDSGLRNQCWKDSTDGVVHPDGSLPGLPLATCELQGYAFDARLRSARLARDCWGDAELARRLTDDAERLRGRFDRDYWLADEGWYAFALDGAGRPVTTLTSNIGQLLWSGIVPAGRAATVVDRLMSPDLFSGWGIRTLAAGRPAYDPLSYHRGSVWPHDNALIAAGLIRYGFRREAERVATALVEAAGRLGHRLPEALVGTDRDRTGGLPVRYPHASQPQAWASAAPLLLVTSLLDLRPRSRAVACGMDLPTGGHHSAHLGVRLALLHRTEPHVDLTVPTPPAGVAPW
ncbi:MAG TPA: glycogen debranching N-terminal domain-containing protein, partial [Kineosporiaceae bacterium]